MLQPARFRKLWDSLRSSYWFVPSVMMAGAALLWLLTSWLDRALTASGALPSPWLYSDDRESVRSLLLTIAASTVGIVGVVFSIMMVPLSIAASQFGPRLLRNFLRDTGTQVTLGTFMATFLFCMLVIVQLHGSVTWRPPQISVTIGLLLGIVSFATLIFFINHVAASVQASVVVAEVSDDLHLAIDRELPDPFVAGAEAPPPGAAGGPDLAQEPCLVLAAASGYVQLRDDTVLMHIAHEKGLVLDLLKEPGDFLSGGTALARLWPEAAASTDVIGAINAAFILGVQRTLVQDVKFGINSLVEVALRALSPAINDPFTAMTCLDWLATALCRACMRSFPAARRYDEQGTLRLITRPVNFTDLANAAFDPVREYGRGSSLVLLRMLDSIATVAQCTRTEEQRSVLLRHALLVERSGQIGLLEEVHREAVTGRYKKVLKVLEQK
jgi:uncharacterized membrane protein